MATPALAPGGLHPRRSPSLAGPWVSLAFSLILGRSLVGAASSSAAFSIPHAALDGGGGRAQSAGYTVDSSLGEWGNLTRTPSSGVTARVGFAGQLNDAPVAANAPVSVVTGQSTAIVLTASDVDRDALTFRVVTGPARGTLSGNAPALTYTPGPGFATGDQFTFVVTDGFTDSAPALITLLGSTVQRRLLPPNRLNDTEFTIAFEGLPNACYRLEGGPELGVWSTVASGQASATGLVTFTDPGPPALVAKFYRVIDLACPPGF